MRTGPGIPVDCPRESPPARGVRRYAMRGTPALAPEARVAAVASYAVAQQAMADYEAAVRTRLAEFDLGFVDRAKVRTLVRRAYGLLRRARGMDALPRARQAAAEAAAQGLAVGIAARVCAECAAALGYTFDWKALAPRARRDRPTMEGSMKQNAVKRPRPKRSRGEPAGVSPERLLADSPFEKVRRERAMLVLAEILRPHEAVVRECVLRRLVDGLSIDEVAARNEMPREEVEEILALMRPQVAKRTDYFASDRCWRDGVGVDWATLRALCGGKV